MKKRSHFVGLPMLGGLALLLAGASFAWACSPQGSIIATPQFGAPGSEIRIEGRGFDAAEVEIHWNDVEGPVLATTGGPTFSVAVEVPDAPEGVYTLVATITNRDGSLGQASAAFEVTAAAPPEAATAPGGDPVAQAATRSGARQTRPADRSRRSGTGSREVEARLDRNAKSAAAPDSVTGPKDKRQNALGAVGSPPGPGPREAERMFPQRRPGTPEDAAARAGRVPVPAQASVWGDLASGFSDRSAVSGAPSIVARGDAQQRTSSGPMMAGGFMAAGLLMLVGAFAAVISRRRPAEIHAYSTKR